MLMRVAPYAISLVALAVTYLILRLNLWLALQGDGAFYQSLSENGAAPARAGQDLAYFPQRLSLLVPERLAVLLLGEQAGYLALRWALAGALTLLAVASVPRCARLATSGLVGVVCATTPPAIGWLSQNYPTLVTGLAIAAGAVTCVALLSTTTRARAGLLWVGLGVIAGLTVHGHWGTAPYAVPVFVAAGLIMLAASRRHLLLSAGTGFVLGSGATLVVVSLLGLWMFDVGTPAQIWQMQQRGFAQIAKVNAAWAGYTDWGWVWWQTTLVLWGVAVVLPIVLQFRTGRWQPTSIVLSGIVAGQLVVGTILGPIGLGNTQYNPQIWPLALLAVTHGVALVASGTAVGSSSARRWLLTLLLGCAALAAAWLGARIGPETGLFLKRSAAGVAGVLAVVALAPALGRRLGGAGRVLEPFASATGLVFTVFLVATAQVIPPGVVSQGPSPAYPELSPQAWIDYTRAFGPDEFADTQRALYLGASVVSETAYEACPTGTRLQYWTSAPSNGYLTWSVFAPYNTATSPYPELPPEPRPVCLVAIGAPWYFAESPLPDGTAARLIAEVPLRDTYHAPDLDDVVRVYEVPGATP
jgi:hypothetical protein